MNGWMARVTTGWHPMRMMRAGIAAMLLISAFNYADWPMGLFGLFFLYQAVTDTGCGLQGCSALRKQNKQNTGSLAEIEYEEIK